ncbi:TnsA endonuclease N-terminal domain-containing protein [Brevibacillus brevis]|uniref:TnsA endonuclease N-terminal domain-containing protein n=1 Tax=Brevibacillus brevis TaxID=1393 RepID=UPI0025A586E2|nr:TnsA endonuclease N-terminal domain-containing protein [Brevibacillus brevis]WJQ78965.1 TnsA endonuclease N-terminal domain-containing protein [Brevibacillus brevis]
MKYGSNYWEQFSPKLKRNVRLFSDLEHDHWILIETDPNIVTFCEQPLEISVFIEGSSVKSVPDMWVRYKSGSEAFLEVKYERELHGTNPKSLRTKRQIQAQTLWCEKHGYHYEVKTDQLIRGNAIFLSNMKQMLTYLQPERDLAKIDDFYVLGLCSDRKISIQEIYQRLEHLGKSRINETLFRLLYEEHLEANLNSSPFGLDTEVWLHDKKEIN